MLDRFRGMGWKKFYLIFGMCDETFSINYTADIPEDVDRGWFMFFVTLLNHLYWVSGATIGGLVGSLLSFDTAGLEFVMTAMFVVIFMEQWKKETIQVSAAVGIGSAVFGMLVVYCLKNVSFISGTHAIPETIAIALTVLLHKWKGNMLFSIAGGTIGYMLLLHLM